LVTKQKLWPKCYFTFVCKRIVLWVNFGPVIPDILWLICIGGKSKVRYALVFKGHALGGSSMASL